MINKSGAISIIDKGLTINGTLSSRGRLIIKGTIKGTLIGETMIIAPEGAVYADTKATDITVAGKFEGNLQASEALTILSTGNCTGKVICKDLIVEAGGILNAEVTCTTVKSLSNGKTVIPSQTAEAKPSPT